MHALRNILCLDLGGTGLKGAIVRDGKILKRASVPTDVLHGRSGIEGTFLRFLAAFSDGEYDAVALSSAGDIDSENKRVSFATALLPGYTGFDLGGFFARHTGKPFECLNDGQAALYGECFARGVAQKTVAMLTLGTGVGGAVVCGSRPAEGGRLLSLGHLPLVKGGRACTCGRRGCIEQYVSGSALTGALSERGIACSKEELWKRYDEGDKRVRDVVGKWLDFLRKSCDTVYERYPFDLMILGGGVSDSGKSWFADFKKSERYSVELSVLGNDAGLLGAFAFFAKRGLMRL